MEISIDALILNFKQNIVPIILSLISSFLWEFWIKLYILEIFPARIYIDGLLFAIVIFILTSYIQKLPIDPNKILNKEESEHLESLLKERHRLELERLKVEHNSDLWNNYSEQIRATDGGINRLERRMSSRQES